VLPTREYPATWLATGPRWLTAALLLCLSATLACHHALHLTRTTRSWAATPINPIAIPPGFHTGFSAWGGVQQSYTIHDHMSPAMRKGTTCNKNYCSSLIKLSNLKMNGKNISFWLRNTISVPLATFIPNYGAWKRFQRDERITQRKASFLTFLG